MLFLSVLLLLVSECMIKSDRLIYHEEYLTEKYEKATSAVQKVKLYKLKTHLPAHSLNHVSIISAIVVVGIFNRPTFVGFAFAPVFFWLHRGLGSKVIGFKDFHYRILMFIICAIPPILLLIVIDSSYYGYLTMIEVQSLEASLDNWVVTPLNFLRYNLDQRNLSQHGLHPWWLHVVVNVPLLFNFLGILALASLIMNICRYLLMLILSY